MDRAELAAILEKHLKWLQDKQDGERADLSGADLSGADLSGADLSGADLRSADLSGAKNLPDAIEWMAGNLEKDDRGYIAYKQFGLSYGYPDRWQIKPGFVLTEVVNPDRCTECACGVNVAKLDWFRVNGKRDKPLWRVLIRWGWLPGVVVPFNSGGKIRCSRVELLETVAFPGLY
jgi:hypothetical protein